MPADPGHREHADVRDAAGIVVHLSLATSTGLEREDARALRPGDGGPARVR
jgi:hypothetical protein